jgi:hypothetical protein
VSKIIFLLGAGASHDAGLPLMAELTTGFPAWLAASTVAHKDRSKLLFEAAVKAVSPAGSSPNIEAILTLLGLVTSLRLGPASQIVPKWKPPFDGPEHETAELAADIREYIVDRLSNVNPNSAGYLHGMLDFQDDEPLDVFTLNYDRLVESMAARFGVRFTTGFADVWDPELFGEQNKWQMRVFKLHGSINWYRLPGRSMIFHGSKEHYAFPGEPPVEVLLYPAEGKESYADPYATLMAGFTRALSEAEFCIAIGYSFRDPHIRRTVLDQLARNPSLQLLVVDPVAQGVLFLPREREDEPVFSDFGDRIAGLWFGAKQALEDRMIGYRLQEIRNADAVLMRVVQNRTGRDFNSAAFDLIDAVERCRSTHLPNKPLRVLRQITGQFQKSMRMAIQAAMNFLPRAAGAPIDQVFAGVGERSPNMLRGGSQSIYFGGLVSCWLLAKALSPPEDVEKITGAMRSLLLRYLRGLLILEDGKYLSWPDPIDPGVDVAQDLAERAANLAALDNELREWPPVTGLELVNEDVRKEYWALASGLTALVELYKIMSGAPPRRMYAEHNKSVIGIGSPAWRVMLLNPLNGTPVGHLFVKLQESKLIKTWLGDPDISGEQSEFADL